MLKYLTILCLLGLTYAGNGYNYPKPAKLAPFPTGNQHHTVSHTQRLPYQQQQQHQQHEDTQEYDKQFYYFNAPEEKLNQGEAAAKQTAAVKKNLNVVLIKAPENKAYERAVENLAKQTVEEQTHVYVLNKETDHAGLAKKIQEVQQGTKSKPEVHFVKYRTSADAHHAQQAIIQHYESSLGGKSTHVHGGVAPIKTVAPANSGSVNRAYLAPSVEKTAQGGHSNVNRAYLAPSSAEKSTQVNRAYLAPAVGKASQVSSNNVKRAYALPPVEQPEPTEQSSGGHVHLDIDTPVDKSYAKNFLPSGIDVVPGSSYIPLRLRH